MTTQDYAEGFSDFYKAVRGFRPRFDTSDWTVADWEAQYAILRRENDENLAAEAEAERLAVAEFESRIVACIRMGAADREAAIRWMADAEDVNDDTDYFCYRVGLPFGYFRAA